MTVAIVTETFTPSLIQQRISSRLGSPVQENATSVYYLELEVAGGGAFQISYIDSILLTLYDVETGHVINGRLNQDVWNAGAGAHNVEIGMGGEITFTLQTDDNIMVDPTKTKRLEDHRMILTIGYTLVDTPELLVHEVLFQVKRNYVPVESN